MQKVIISASNAGEARKEIKQLIQASENWNLISLESKQGKF